MENLLGADYSFVLNSVGCFRIDLCRTCGDNPHSLRRWHQDQLKVGRIKEWRDFVVVRESPGEIYQDDCIFYFRSAIRVWEKSKGREVDSLPISLKTLHQYGFQIIGQEVVKRNQLNLFDLNKGTSQDAKPDLHTSNAFNTLLLRQSNRGTVLQRYTDHYFNAATLCRVGKKRWSEVKKELDAPNSRLGSHLRVLELELGISINNLVQTRTVNPQGKTETWLHPRVAFAIAQDICPDFAEQIYIWESTDKKERVISSTPAVRFPDDFLKNCKEELKSFLSDSLDRNQRELLMQFANLKKEQEKRIFDIFQNQQKKLTWLDSWNQEIRKLLDRTIPIPLQYWKSLTCKPNRNTETSFPFVYVIVVYPESCHQGNPEVFYVGQSRQQPYERFGNHDGLKSIEAITKYGFSYEIYYYESPDFEDKVTLDRIETALELALNPYWVNLSPQQHILMKRGELIAGELFKRLYTKAELKKIA